MSGNTIHESEARALLSFADDRQKPSLLELKRGGPEAAVVAAVPKGLELRSVKELLDEYAPRPERRAGEATLTTLESFIEHTNRFKDGHSVVFASDELTDPRLVAVLDYHEQGAAGAPRFGEHRGVYRFPLSEEWQAWHQVHRKELRASAFAEFLEDRIGDVIDPGNAGDAVWKLAEQLAVKLASPSELIALSRGLNVNIDSRVAQHQNLQSGEARLHFEVQHQGVDGTPLRVPGGFAIQVPVFRGGPLYKLAVRLRYRVAQGAVTWVLVMHRTDLVFRHALDEACEQVKAETSLPLLFGRPEE